MVKTWYMDNSEDDQRLEHHLNPPKFVELEDLYHKTGVEYFKIDITQGSDDKLLKDLRNERGYDYEDDLTCSRESLKNYDQMLKKFYTEHLHDGQEIRLVLEGSGYFDVRDNEDKWIRVQVTPGDLIILPGGIYHRFTLDTKNFIRVKRYFIGQPVWTPYNRPVDEMECRKEYLNRLNNTGLVYK